MKKLKGFIFIILILILAACGDGESNNNDSANGTNQAVSGDLDPFGKYEEPITIAIGAEVDPSDTSLLPGETPLNNKYVNHVKENLNINVEHYFTASPSNMDQKISLAIASNDLPDAMVVGPVHLRQMVEADQIADLTEIYENYISDEIREVIDSTDGEALESATFDGKLMAIPNVQARADGIHNLWIRQDWLDNLGLDVPQTVEELKEVARAFVEDDPDGNGIDDTIGLAGPGANNKINANFLESSNNLYGFDGIFSAFHSYPGYWLEGDDGEPVYGSLLPETKEALGFLRDMYAEGLIDPEMGVRENPRESVVAGEVGMFFGPFWMPYDGLVDAVKENPEANWQSYAAPLDENGDYTPHLMTPTNEYVVVRKDYEHPEAVVKMLNNLFAHEDEFDHMEGGGGPGHYPLRLVYAPEDEMEVTTIALREVLAGTKEPEDFYDMPAYKLLKKDVDTIFDTKLEPYDDTNIQYWDTESSSFMRAYSALVGTAPLVDTEIKGVKSLIYTQTETMESHWVNLQKLEDETFLKIIMGAEPLDVFDQFVEDWKNQGGDEITKEVAEMVK